MKTIIDIIESFEQRKKEALIYKTDYRTFRWDYRKLLECIKRFAGFLHSQGIKAGDKIMILSHNRPEWVITHLGTIYYGAVSVPVDILATDQAIDNIAKKTMPKLIVKTRYRPELKHKAKTVIIEDLEFILEDKEPWKRKIKAKEEELIELVFTSGTTGDPKGVMLTHKNIMANVKDIMHHIDIRKQEHMLSLLPLSHMLEQVPGLLTPLSAGGTITYITSLKPSMIFKALETEDITATIAVPRILQSIRSKVEQEAEASMIASLFPQIVKYRLHKRLGKSFRFIVSGGAALDKETEDFWDRMGFKIIQGYGLTECSPVLTANTDDVQKKQTAGLPLKSVSIKIAEDGEILAKGDNVFDGYYHDEDKTKTALKDGWFYTGDLGEMDDDGFLIIKGRKKDVITKSSGVNVYPSDIEHVLNNISGVKESCVIGMPTRQGEEVHAVIMPEGKQGIRKIIDKANESLNSSQQITEYTLWPEPKFPRSSTLKIKKNIVKEKILEKDTKETEEAPSSKIANLLARVSPVSASRITPEKRLSSDLKIDSIGRVELVSLIEQEYNFDFEENLINQKTKVKDLKEMIEKRKTAKPKLKQPEWAQTRFFIILRRFWLRAVNNKVISLWCRVKVEGLENIDKIKQPVIFAANHQSYFDYPCFLKVVPKRFRDNINAPAYAEFFTKYGGNPLMWVWKRLSYYYAAATYGVVMMPETHSFKKSLQYTGKLVDKGRNIIIFPEGAHRHGNELQEFKLGTALLIQQLRIPVIPVGIKGTDDIFPPQKTLPKFERGNATILFGKPIMFKTESGKEIIDKLREEIEVLRQ